MTAFATTKATAVFDDFEYPLHGATIHWGSEGESGIVEGTIWVPTYSKAYGILLGWALFGSFQTFGIKLWYGDNGVIELDDARVWKNRSDDIQLHAPMIPVRFRASVPKDGPKWFLDDDKDRV